MAAADVEALIAGRAPPHTQPPAHVAGPGFACLYLRVPEGAPPEFQAAARVAGPGGSYLGHVAAASGALCTLRGRGCGLDPRLEGPDPLHVYLSCPDAARLEEART